MLPRTNGPTVTTKLHQRQSDEEENMFKKDRKHSPARKQQPPPQQLPAYTTKPAPLQNKNLSPVR